MTIDRLTLLLRRSRRIAFLVFHLVWGVTLAGLVFPVVSLAQRDRLIMGWAQRLLRVLGVRAQVAAAPRLPSGALLVCNHVSWLDIYLIYAAQRVHFVSKAEVRAWPVTGWLAHKTGTLFLERGRRADTARVNAEIRSLMRNGSWVAVFPEGTTSDGTRVHRFMPSLLQPAVELGCPIVPAALRYRTLSGAGTTAPAFIGDLSLWQSLLQIISKPGLIAELHFGEPIAPDGHRRELAPLAEAATAALLGMTSEAAAGGRPSTQLMPGSQPAQASAAADTTRQRPADPRA